MASRSAYFSTSAGIAPNVLQLTEGRICNTPCRYAFWLGDVSSLVF